MSFQQEQFNTLAAMCHQESTSYKCEDYLHRRAQSPTCAMFIDDSDSSMSHEDIQVCIGNRTKMAQWCMTLMDACQLHRETVSIAMNYLDRFMATSFGEELVEDSAGFQLASMTALYCAIKIHEEKAISPDVLSTISRGFYSKKDMEAMELRMLNAIQWRVNVPTPLAFVREYLQILPLDDDTKDQILAVSQIQTELSVSDYSFVTVNASSVGFAALVNAMDVLGVQCDIVNHYILNQNLVDTDEVFQIQSSLYAAVANMGSLRSCEPRRTTPSSRHTSAPKRRQSHTISPRSVHEHAC